MAVPIVFKRRELPIRLSKCCTKTCIEAKSEYVDNASTFKMARPHIAVGAGKWEASFAARFAMDYMAGPTALSCK
jgi:hypothetical protein